jgi:hypothetical protein
MCAVFGAGSLRTAGDHTLKKLVGGARCSRSSITKEFLGTTIGLNRYAVGGGAAVASV